MQKSFLLTDYTPTALRLNHPLVQHYLRQPGLRYVKQLICGSSVGLFVLFGGLSLPMLYFLLSLIILMQMAIGTAERIYRAQQVRTWDLMCVAPFSKRDILLSTWAAGMWQLKQTWTMPMYRLLHGVVVIGAIIFGLWFGEIPLAHGPLLLLGGTLLIAAQPMVEIYFSGMIGLLCVSLIRDRTLALWGAGFAAAGYWALWVGGLLLLTTADLKSLQTVHLLAIFNLPLLLPLLFGYLAQRVAEARLA